MTFKLTRLFPALAGIFLMAAGAFAQNTGSIRGTVTDPSGASIPNATIAATGNGVSRQAKTDSGGRYTITGLPGGKFNVRGDAKGFVTFMGKDVNVSTGQPASLDIPMTIATEAQEVQVSDNSQTAISVDPSQNVGAIVLKAADIDALPDDPDDLQNDLQALAGPAAGPNGAQFFIDGFSGGQLPPKSSIREIRINSNPFSSEFDKPGFGRVEIFTKPGSDKFHGGANFNFGDKFLNSRNPFLVGQTPDYISEFYGFNFTGPVNKRTSFSIDGNRRSVDDNAIIKAFDPATNFTTQLGTGIVTPSRLTTISPRLDYAISPTNTLVVRYHWTESTNQNSGLGSYSLLSQAESTASHNNTVQATETSIIGTKAVNETRFQFNDAHSNQNGSGVGGPTISIPGVATFGGAPILANFTHILGFELSNNTTMTLGAHTVKFGVRLRDSSQDQSSTSNFNGSFQYASIAAYQANTPLQFSLAAGTPLLNVKQFDAGLFFQDDWRVKPNLTVSVGARYEAQTNISDHGDIAPRISFAWAPFAHGTKASKTVVRAGYGFFYDRLDDNLTLNTYRYNGIANVNYLLNSATAPLLYTPSNFPTLAALAANKVDNPIYKLDANTKATVLEQLAIGFDQQLPLRMTLSMNYINSRGVHESRQRNINAPDPALYQTTGTVARPYGNIGDIYLYENSGILKQQQIIANVNARVNRWIQMSGYYSYGKANDDSSGFPSNQYNTKLDFGRAAFDVRNRGGIFGSVALPYAISLAPFLTFSSGRPYNVTTGFDRNGDGILNDRPAFATSATLPQNLKVTKLGSFDLNPAYGTPTVPIDYLEGPGNVSLNLTLSRTFGWGERSSGNPNAQNGMGGGPPGGGGDRGGGGARGGGGGGRGGGPGGGGFGGGMGGMMRGGMGGANTGKKYNLTVRVEARNAINHVNLNTPSGSLLSPNFGVSTGLGGGGFGGGPGGGGGNSAAGNRRISLQLRFSF